MAARTAGLGAAYGLFPIGWIILNVIFFYQLTVKRGLFDALRESLARVAPDPRIQVVLIAFSFGAFIEGMAGFGTPVAITGAILIQLGFKPLHASGLALIANTAPVAFGSLGIPITTLEQVTGLDAKLVSAMVGRQLPFFAVLVPFWVVTAFAGWRGMLGVWPAALTAGVSFALPQFLVSNFHGPWLVDAIAGACSIASTVLLLRFWRPRTIWQLNGGQERAPARTQASATNQADPVSSITDRKRVVQAWLPWAILAAFIFLWGTPQFKGALDRLAAPEIRVERAVVAVEKPGDGVAERADPPQVADTAGGRYDRYGCSRLSLPCPPQRDSSHLRSQTERSRMRTLASLNHTKLGVIHVVAFHPAVVLLVGFHRWDVCWLREAEGRRREEEGRLAAGYRWREEDEVTPAC